MIEDTEKSGSTYYHLARKSNTKDRQPLTSVIHKNLLAVNFFLKYASKLLSF